jgi:hypothetical protein
MKHETSTAAILLIASGPISSLKDSFSDLIFLETSMAGDLPSSVKRRMPRTVARDE